MSESQKVDVQQDEEHKSPHYANCIEEITALIRGRVPIIWVVTHEETRFIQDFTESIANPIKRQTFLWSSYQGLVRYGQENTTPRATGDDKDTWNPQRGLQRIMEINVPKEQRGHAYILRDFHTVLAEPIPRQMRDMYDHLIANRKTLIITSPILAHGPGGSKSGLPATLEKQVHVVYYELPTKEQIETRMRSILGLMKENNEGKQRKTAFDYNDAQYNTFSRALQGLTLLEVEHAISTSLTHCKRLDAEKLVQDKRQILRKSEILEFIDTPTGLNEIGGLDLVKSYLTKYTKAHSKEALAFGVEPLKGILLTGVPGTGKSALAKAIGKLWEVPLLRLDVGKVMTGLVGGSEGKMREVINQAEAMAPCVTGDSLVTLTNGNQITIKELHRTLTSTLFGESVSVKSLNENGFPIDVKVHTVIRRSAEEKKLLKITLESGKQITVTENHKLLVYNDNNIFWKEAKNLTEDDNVMELD